MPLVDGLKHLTGGSNGCRIGELSHLSPLMLVNVTGAKKLMADRRQAPRSPPAPYPPPFTAHRSWLLGQPGDPSLHRLLTVPAFALA
jgi:hypothetical protein